MASQAAEQLRATIARNIDSAIGQRTNREIAQRMDKSEMQVQKWRKGKTGIELENLAAIADVTGRPLSWFYIDHEADFGTAA